MYVCPILKFSQSKGSSCANKEIENCPQALQHIGTLDDFNNIIHHENKSIADEIFCCLSHDFNDFIAQIMKFCDAKVIRFYYIPRMFGTYRLRLKPEFMGETLLYTNHVEPLAIMSNRIIKRSFDIAVSLIACLCILPFIPIIANLLHANAYGIWR